MAADGNYRAGLYDRVSTLGKGRDDRSVREQNAANKEACDRYGWTVTARYADPGRSASRFARRAREDYKRLLADITEERIDVVVFWESSRGGRELEAWARLLNECRRHKVKIYITNHDQLYDMSKRRDWRALADEGVSSADRSEEISDYVNRAMRANAAAGRPHGQTPFGYRRVYDEHTRVLIRQEPDPDRSWIPREIITRIAAGDSLRSICEDFRDRNVPTPAMGEWNHALLRRIATNPVYIGKHAYKIGGQPAQEKDTKWWPAIADEAEFRDAGEILARRAGRSPGAVKHLLSYVAVCGVCGKPLTAGKRGAHPLYFCWDRGHVAVREDWLDAYVTGHVCGRLNTPAFWDELENGGDAESRLARAKESELRGLLREYRKRAIAKTIEPEDFEEIAAGLRSQINEAHAIATRRHVSPLLQAFRDDPDKDLQAIREMFESKPIAVRKEIIREMYSKIELLPAARKGRWSGFDKNRVKMVPAKPGGVRP